MHFAIRRALCIGVASFLFVSFLTFILTSAGQQRILPADKISAVVNATLNDLHAHGINSKNAILMNLPEHYNTPLTRFDERGRFGLLLDVSNVTPSLVSQLEALGGNVLISLVDAKLIAVYMPIDEIEEVTGLNQVMSVNEITGGTLNIGSVKTEGDSIHHAINIRSDLSIMGDNVNVGVISDGCVSYLQSQATGDLPPGFGAPNFIFNNPVNPNKIGLGDEGTAMMEIIYDLAPNANLYFYGALNDAAGSAAHIDAIQRLVREKGCKVIVDDLTWYNQPMFEDGTVATLGTVAAAAKWANDTGVVYISSAGNWANGPGTPLNPIDRSHYQAMYNDINTVSNVKENKPLPNGPIPAGYPPPNWDDLHNFDPTPGAFDPGLSVIVPAGKTLTVVLEWADPSMTSTDPWGGSKDDYDLYIYDATLTFNLTGMTGAGSQTGTQNPWEKVSLTNYEGGPTEYNIVINHRDTIPKPPPKLLGLYISGCSATQYWTPQNSIWGQPGVTEVIAVGAVPQNNITNIEAFSSLGNYDVYVPAFVSRPKPDIVAVDGVQVTGVGGFGSPFFGTSASAPHVAGLAALLLSWNTSMTPANIHSKFERTATDLGAAGFDNTYGYGRADVEQAFYEVDTAISVHGPYTLHQGVGTPPMFFTTPDGYAISILGINDPLNLFPVGQCQVTVPEGSPYSSAGVEELGCPTIRRWYIFNQTGSTQGQYTAYIDAYFDESERITAGIDTSQIRIIHWNGSYYHALSQSRAAKRIGNTWRITAVYPNAYLSPFFLGYLTKGLDVVSVSNDSGGAGSTATVKFSINNTGSGLDLIQYYASDVRGWVGIDTTGRPNIKGGQDTTIEIKYKISSSAPVGTMDTIWLLAKSVADPSAIDSASAFVKVLKRELDVVTVSNDSGGPNTVAKVKFNVVNMGDVGDTIACRISDQYGWSLFPTDSTFFLSSSNDRELSIEISIPSSAGLSDIDTIRLVASSVPAPSIKDSSFAIVKVLFNKFVLSVKDGWNMISIPTVSDSNWKTALFPTSITNAFTYIGSYQITDTLYPGIGYWLKFTGAQSVELRGQASQKDTITVVAGWNMIGTVLSPQPVDHIASSPDGMIISSFYTYNGTYNETDTLQPGYGYWVKVDTIGHLILGNTSGIIAANHVRIIHTNVMPPPPPGEQSQNGQPDIPTSYSLEQNYPNPFNPSTIINYQLPIDNYVILKVYNMLGQEVVTLINGQESAGYKSVVFNAHNLPSGIYTYKLTAGGSTINKKMILLR
jgi:hypothetical protein